MRPERSDGWDDLGDPEPWVCGDPDPDNADLDRHDRKHEPYFCGAEWAPRTEDERNPPGPALGGIPDLTEEEADAYWRAIGD